MARLKRFCPVGIAQHVIQRGNNRQVCFNGDEDFAAYAHWLKEFADKYEETFARSVFKFHIKAKSLNFKFNSLIFHKSDAKIRLWRDFSRHFHLTGVTLL